MTTALARAVLGGDRAKLAQAITLVESTRAADFGPAQALLAELLPHAGRSLRIGVTGVPGVGKSSFIDALGSLLIGRGHRVAVLAIDPSSARSGGSILGDRTRMRRLSVNPAAFVRPSPSALTLGGVARATRETVTLVEASGFDIVLIETVGVGQSEYVVSAMVDTVLLLMLARTGDSLQGMKRGILELADVIAVNKADGDHVAEARVAARELAGALRLVHPAQGSWQPPTLTCSAVTEAGIEAVWSAVERHIDAMGPAGLARKRAGQAVDWTRSLVRDALLARLDTPDVRAHIERLEAEVLDGSMPPALAADRIVELAAGEDRSDEGARTGARRQPAGEDRSDEGARTGARGGAVDAGVQPDG